MEFEKPLSAYAARDIMEAAVALRTFAARPRVYLAGPIDGLLFDEANTWRDTAALALAPEIVAYSPMRGKQSLDNGRKITGAYDASILANSRAITTRDRADCTRADLVIAHLAGAKKVSIGTVMEIAWADAHRIPLVLIGEDGDCHDHPMIRECAGWRVNTLAEAIYVARSVLLP